MLFLCNINQLLLRASDAHCIVEYKFECELTRSDTPIRTHKLGSEPVAYLVATTSNHKAPLQSYKSLHLHLRFHMQQTKSMVAAQPSFLGLQNSQKLQKAFSILSTQYIYPHPLIITTGHYTPYITHRNITHSSQGQSRARRSLFRKPLPLLQIIQPNNPIQPGK